MPNLLFVSIAFPPKNDPECLQTARYFKYLVRTGKFHIDVVTSKRPTLFMEEDPSLFSYLDGYFQLVELPLWETRWSSFALRKAGLGNLLFPDSKMTFHWQWKKAIRKLHRKPDIIYSRSNPMSSAFMASKLSQFYQVPWVMHMSDPWLLSPLKKEPSPKQLQSELRLLRNTSAVTFTTAATRDRYASAYPDLRDRFGIMPNVFDPDDEFCNTIFQNDKLRIVYTGGLTVERSLSFLTDVLRQVEKVEPALLNDLEILAAGPMDRANRNFFHDNKYKCLSHLGTLSYQDALQLQRQSNLLLVVDNPTSGRDAIFFPSKILDYFLTGQPIIAITPLESTARRILQDYKSYCFTHSDVAGLAQFLIQEIKNRSPIGRQAILLPEKYNAKNNADLLSELLMKNLNK